MAMNHSRDIARFAKLLLATSLMVYLLIVIGGIVRVTGSGLGCPDWPRCFGQWIPPLRADAIIEYVHRLVATLTSPLILASAFVGWWRFRASALLSKPLLYAIILLAIQGLLGGIVVLLETPADLVAVHLTIAFIIQALILVPTVVASTLPDEVVDRVRLRFDTDFGRIALQATIVVFIMIISGALVVGSDSTYACSGWPLCNGQLIPSHPNGWLHMLHRLMVLIAALFVLRLYLTGRRNLNKDSKLMKLNNLTFWLFGAQVLVGAMKVSLAFPIWLLGAHVAVAAAVWVSVVLTANYAGLSHQLKEAL